MARKRASMREGPLAELFKATEAAQRQQEQGQDTAAPAAEPLLTADLSPAATIAHLVRVGRALRRSPVVRATLRGCTGAG